MAATWDLLVRGGTLVDPAQSISARRDVAFSSGKVAAVAEALTGEATDVIDARGALVTAAIGKSNELGSLAPGMAGDAAVLDLEEGHFTYVDGAGNEVKATRRFRTRHVIRDGRRLSAAHADQL